MAMKKGSSVLGIDLGTSGVRIALLNINYELEHFSAIAYLEGLENCKDWQTSCKKLITQYT